MEWPLIAMSCLFLRSASSLAIFPSPPLPLCFPPDPQCLCLSTGQADDEAEVAARRRRCDVDSLEVRGDGSCSHAKCAPPSSRLCAPRACHGGSRAAQVGGQRAKMRHQAPQCIPPRSCILPSASPSSGGTQDRSIQSTSIARVLCFIKATLASSSFWHTLSHEY